VVDVLLGAGALQLASAALIGWIIALDRADPERTKRLGIKVPRRLMQLHLDQVMMGLILLAVASAFPDVPGWIVVPLLIGTTVNPLLFLPLAFWPKLDQQLGYRIITVLSFIAATIAFVGLAIWVIGLR
jgi:hydroxylaminobenzene mutase